MFVAVTNDVSCSFTSGVRGQKRKSQELSLTPQCTPVTHSHADSLITMPLACLNRIAAGLTHFVWLSSKLFDCECILLPASLSWRWESNKKKRCLGIQVTRLERDVSSVALCFSMHTGKGICLPRHWITFTYVSTERQKKNESSKYRGAVKQPFLLLSSLPFVTS